MADPKVSAVAQAIKREFMAQYRGADWEEAKDVAENLDFLFLAIVALRALRELDNPSWKDMAL